MKRTRSARQGIESPERNDGGKTPWLLAGAASVAVLLLYVVTLAPTTQFWDASEYIATAHILGIPHPPGNPLFVILARAWELLLAPTGLSVAVRLNLFSAVSTAAAHFFWFLAIHRVLTWKGGDRTFALVAAFAGTALSATAFTVWNQSNVNEKVYTLSLLTISLAVWIMLVWRDRITGVRMGKSAPVIRGHDGTAQARESALATRNDEQSGKLLILVAFLLALSATNHLMGLLAGPALLLFVLVVQPRALADVRVVSIGLLAAAVGFSVFAFLPIRAALDPLINEADPSTWQAFLDSLTRKQYAKPSILTSPLALGLPRDPGLMVAQFSNWLQYFDWQWARSIAGEQPWFGGVRPLATTAAIGLGVLGGMRHWREDRQSAALFLVLFLTLSLGLTFYLNFKYGFSAPIDGPVIADEDPREVRERDYFFLAGFSVWGLWMGVGVAALWQRAMRAMAIRRTQTARASASTLPIRWAAAPILAIALVPLALNWSWATRSGDWTARDWAYNALMSVEPYGILITNGDNDTFPLWYLQEVEGIRQDVSVIVTSYLGAAWYAKQVRDLSRPCAAGEDPTNASSRIICQRSFDAADGPWGNANLPEDSVLPLSDAEIERVAQSAIRLSEPAILEAGAIRTSIAAGTVLVPSDTFLTAILSLNANRRPIHFVVPSPVLTRLNLHDYTVRSGVTFRLHTAESRPDASESVIELTDNQAPQVLGRYVDVGATAKLFEDVFELHGAPASLDVWADSATKNIPAYYAWGHFALGQALAQQGEADGAAEHYRRADAWSSWAQ